MKTTDEALDFTYFKPWLYGLVTLAKPVLEVFRSSSYIKVVTLTLWKLCSKVR